MKIIIIIISIAFVCMASVFVPENEPFEFTKSDTIKKGNTKVIVCSNNFTDSTITIYVYSGNDSIFLMLKGNQIIHKATK